MAAPPPSKRQKNFSPHEEQTSAATDLEHLQKKVESLRAEIAALKQTMQTLEAAGHKGILEAKQIASFAVRRQRTMEDDLMKLQKENLALKESLSTIESRLRRIERLNKDASSSEAAGIPPSQGSLRATQPVAPTTPKSTVAVAASAAGAPQTIPSTIPPPLSQKHPVSRIKSGGFFNSPSPQSGGGGATTAAPLK